MTSIQQVYSQELSFTDIDLSDEEIYLYMGYGGQQPDERIMAILNDLKEELKEICRPCFGYKYIAGQTDGNTSLYIGEKKVHPGTVITGYLKKSTAFFLLLATAGEAFDHWMKTLQTEGDIVKLYIADALGSAIAEATAAKARLYLSEQAGILGCNTSNSYSPGYCGWDVAEQKILFSLLPENFCRIRLTESSLMLPIKSVSAVVGIGKELQHHPYGCAICRKTDCFKRRVTAQHTI